MSLLLEIFQIIEASLAAPNSGKNKNNQTLPGFKRIMCNKRPMSIKDVQILAEHEDGVEIICDYFKPYIIHKPPYEYANIIYMVAAIELGATSLNQLMYCNDTLPAWQEVDGIDGPTFKDDLSSELADYLGINMDIGEITVNEVKYPCVRVLDEQNISAYILMNGLS